MSRWHFTLAVLLPAYLVSRSTVVDGAFFPPRRRTLLDNSLGAEEAVDVAGRLGLRVGNRRRAGAGGGGGVDKINNNIFKNYGNRSGSKTDRTCDTNEERDCYRPCKEDKCDGGDGKKCRQICREECCVREAVSDGAVGEKSETGTDKDATEGEDANSDGEKPEDKDREEDTVVSSKRSCDKKEEKECRGLCFETEKCNESDDEVSADRCRKACRQRCCDNKKGDREEDIMTNEDFFASDESDSEGDGPQADGKGDEGKHSDPNEAETARPTESPSRAERASATLFPTKAPSVLSMSPSGDKLLSQDLDVLLTFDIRNLGDLSADDIMSGNANTMKIDIEAGLGLLMPEILEEVFEERRRRLQSERRELMQSRPDEGGGNSARPSTKKFRRLFVQYNEGVPPSVIGATEMECPADIVSGLCYRINATSTLTVMNESEQSVLKTFQAATIEAIDEGRLDDKMKSLDPNSTIAAIVAEKHERPGVSSTKSRVLVSIGFVFGLLLAIPTLVYCFSPLFDKDRRRREEPSENADGSFPRLEGGDESTNRPRKDADSAYDLTQIDEVKDAAPSAEESH